MSWGRHLEDLHWRTNSVTGTYTRVPQKRNVMSNVNGDNSSTSFSFGHTAHQGTHLDLKMRLKN